MHGPNGKGAMPKKCKTSECTRLVTNTQQERMSAKTLGHTSQAPELVHTQAWAERRHCASIDAIANYGMAQLLHMHPDLMGT
eukprot:855308-Amphidinium_carterae.1